MRLVQIKDSTQLPDLGVDIQLQVLDGNVEAVVITSLIDSSKFVRIVRQDTYNNNLKVLTSEPLAEKEVWVLSGKLLGLSEFREEFESEDDAQSYYYDLKNTQNLYDEERIGLSITKEIKLVEKSKI